jgi:hypothetical protein
MGKQQKTNSRRNLANNVLGVLSEEEIKRFLMDSVNLPWSVTYPDHRAHFERWLKRWQRLFTYLCETKPQYDGPSLKDILEGNAEPPEREYPLSPPKEEWDAVQVPREELELFAPVVRTTLCRLWKERDARQRDWYCYRLRDAHRQMVRHLEGWHENPIWGGVKTPEKLLDYALQEVPRISPFEAAIYWLQLNPGLMLHCGNPLCEAPYFFRAENAKKQTYCSPECADPARREAKLKWWKANRSAKKSSR